MLGVLSHARRLVATFSFYRCLLNTSASVGCQCAQIFVSPSPKDVGLKYSGESRDIARCDSEQYSGFYIRAILMVKIAIRA